jgi:hypothetical protein
MQYAANSRSEALAMSDNQNGSFFAQMVNPLSKTASHTVQLARAAVLLVSIAAAIPTAYNLYYSWKHGIPFSQVSHRLAQYDLWMKNLDCKIDYRALATAGGTKVDVGACANSGDIAIKVSSSDGHATYEWIAFNELQKPTQAGLMGLVIPAALAAEVVPPQSQPQPQPQSSRPLPVGSVQVAQAGLEVVCQAKEKDTIIRIVKEAGKCFRETLSPFKGTVDKRSEVPCTATCK